MHLFFNNKTTQYASPPINNTNTISYLQLAIHSNYASTFPYLHPLQQKSIFPVKHSPIVQDIDSSQVTVKWLQSRIVWM